MRIGPLGGWEILIILVVILLLFGANRLPKIARALGESTREVRKGFQDLKNDIDEDKKADEDSRTSGGSDR